MTCLDDLYGYEQHWKYFTKSLYYDSPRGQTWMWTMALLYVTTCKMDRMDVNNNTFPYYDLQSGQTLIFFSKCHIQTHM
jgi:hypothetical protein